MNLNKFKEKYADGIFIMAAQGEGSESYFFQSWEDLRCYVQNTLPEVLHHFFLNTADGRQLKREMDAMEAKSMSIEEREALEYHYEEQLEAYSSQEQALSSAIRHELGEVSLIEVNAVDSALWDTMQSSCYWPNSSAYKCWLKITERQTLQQLLSSLNLTKEQAAEMFGVAPDMLEKKVTKSMRAQLNAFDEVIDEEVSQWLTYIAQLRQIDPTLNKVGLPHYSCEIDFYHCNPELMKKLISLELYGTFLERLKKALAMQNIGATKVIVTFDGYYEWLNAHSFDLSPSASIAFATQQLKSKARIKNG